MPRQARLDATGVLQHVMARGIERRKIFWDDKDRASFLERLAVILEQTQTQCYAWALIPNHFHILLRTGTTPLSTVMRRLMTGYAVTFNIRHRRSGHLFQNRYKSIVCEEDPYLLELIRYIHLNPLRAKLVEDLNALDKYPWTGHSAILGRRKNPLIPKLEKEVSSADKRIGFSQFHLETEKARMNSENPACPARHVESEGHSFGVAPADGTGVNPARPVKFEDHLTGVKKEKSLAEKTIEDVLRYFGESFKVARRRYRQFVKNGIEQGKRPEFQGGGLVRSAGGNKAGLLGRKKEARETGDARILGSGYFVNEALSKAGEEWESQTGPRPSLKALINTVSEAFDLTSEQLKSRSRRKPIVDARSVLAKVAVRNHGYKGIEVAEALSLSPSSVSRIVESGENILDNKKDVAVKIADMEI
ncbi:MAG: transposase [Desulfobacterales bacterium]|nr:transposase [Desulfobacterales bacterium]